MGLTAACTPGQADLSGETAEDESSESSSVRRVLLCQQGLSDRTTGWDKGLFDVCESAGAAGFEVIWDGDYPAFGALNENGAYAALFDTLDDNGDGWVDEDDTPTQIYLVGFSWGGINTSDVAERLWLDWRVAIPRAYVTGMVLFDPYQPQVSRVKIGANVKHAWVYRQTETTDGDCSETVSLGFGFNGHRPKAKSANNECTFYDLDAFAGEVGHCDVPYVARNAAITNLTKLEDHEPWDAWAEVCPLK